MKKQALLVWSVLLAPNAVVCGMPEMRTIEFDTRQVTQPGLSFEVVYCDRYKRQHGFSERIGAAVV